MPLDYTKELDLFVLCLDEERFFDAHEALEAIWFPRRYENDVEMNEIKGLINAAVSFELTKRGRREAATKVWKNYEKYRPLLDTFYFINTTYYKQLCQRLESMRKDRITP